MTFGHGVYLVVWSDMRSGDHAVYGARIALDGTVLDPGGRLYSSEPSTARMPAVAATSDGFMLAWAQAAPDGHGFVPRALRLNADGSPKDTAPIKIAEVGPWNSGEDFGHHAFQEAICQHVRVAVAGNTAAIVWGGTNGREQGYFIERAMIAVDTGQITVPAGKAVEGAASRIHNPDVAPFGDQFIFSWLDHRGRGETGLPNENVGLLALDGTARYFPLKDDGNARTVLAPAVNTNGLVAFVEPKENQQLGRKIEYRLFLRQLDANGASTGDTAIFTGAAWPAMAAHQNGKTLLVYTRIDQTERNAMLDAVLVTSP